VKEKEQKHSQYVEEKSISIHFEEQSPFHKKSVAWDCAVAVAPGSPKARNALSQAINSKKQELSMA
jgi:hypothetical protein